MEEIPQRVGILFSCLSEMFLRKKKSISEIIVRSCEVIDYCNTMI
jgi:hypothetical protein